MYILTNNNVVFISGEVIEAGRWENDPYMDTYRIKNGDNYQYAVITGFELHQVDSLPDDFEPNKYLYTEADGFTINPYWNEEPEPQEQLYTLDQAANLLAQEVSNE